MLALLQKCCVITDSQYILLKPCYDFFFKEEEEETNIKIRYILVGESLETFGTWLPSLSLATQYSTELTEK